MADPKGSDGGLKLKKKTIRELSFTELDGANGGTDGGFGDGGFGDGGFGDGGFGDGGGGGDGGWGDGGDGGQQAMAPTGTQGNTDTICFPYVSCAENA